ncbi:MAG: hypothetical protein P3X23_003435 [Thermosynechococcus sp. Uc]|uniref:hypothetical protein n=1 Tax=Thermosynechococcus sp. Uc TaxID=3034853 RepID=UPI0019F32C20|nr:hypothetical protein [Thermosynechococcus sp. Uc]MDM7326160.1 hypothetical protein [Thermosynechococcus sp. Uc]HIK25065.1 hypothetical protein [Thermosynechococcus sp. M46_R2017_013]
MDYPPIEIEYKPSRSRPQAGVLDIPWKKRPRRSFGDLGTPVSHGQIFSEP